MQREGGVNRSFGERVDGLGVGVQRLGVIIQPHLALAAITAAPAVLADVIITGVLGAEGADARGGNLTNAARERH